MTAQARRRPAASSNYIECMHSLDEKTLEDITELYVADANDLRRLSGRRSISFRLLVR